MQTFLKSNIFNSIIMILITGLGSWGLMLYDTIKQFEFDNKQFTKNIEEIKQHDKELQKDIDEIQARLNEFENTLMQIYRSKNK